MEKNDSVFVLRMRVCSLCSDWFTTKHGYRGDFFCRTQPMHLAKSTHCTIPPHTYAIGEYPQFAANSPQILRASSWLPYATFDRLFFWEICSFIRNSMRAGACAATETLPQQLTLFEKSRHCWPSTWYLTESCMHALIFSILPFAQHFVYPIVARVLSEAQLNHTARIVDSHRKPQCLYQLPLRFSAFLATSTFCISLNLFFLFFWCWALARSGASARVFDLAHGCFTSSDTLSSPSETTMFFACVEIAMCPQKTHHGGSVLVCNERLFRSYIDMKLLMKGLYLYTHY